ncbi:MAG: choice-of-anchor D domain-containing protein, partial [Silvibacterium sp.]
RPESTGSLSEAVTVTDDAANSPQTVPLTGKGVTGSMLFSPTSLTFASVVAGTVSPSQAVTLTNETSAAVGLTAITVSGHFAQTNNCPSPLGAGASCTVTVTSNPTTSGATTGSGNVKDSTGNTTLLYLSGAGSAAGGSISLSPSSYTFPNQVSGTSSAPAAFTVTNTQSVAVSISSIALSNAVFTETDNCVGSLAASASCTISVTFTPQSSGTQSATLSVNDSASGSPQKASLTGTGTTSGSSNVTLNPASYNFPTQGAGTVSSPVAFALTNGEASALAISSISISNTNFAQTNNCGSSLAAGANCTISVEFTPASSSAQSATLSVSDNVGGSPQTASLTGNTTAATVNVKPANVAFGPQILGRPSSPQSVTVTNTTSTPVTISAITLSGSAFSITNSCIPSGSGSGTLAAGSSCSVSVIFDPTVAGSATGSVAITTSSPSGGVSIPLAGTGEVGDTAPSLVITPQASCVLPSGTQQFATQAENTNNTAVTWYVNSVKNGDSYYGTISTNGFYVAPTATGTYTVLAVTQGNTSLSASTTIAVTNSPIFSIYPYTSSIPVGGQQTFQAQVCSVPDNNSSVTFTVDNIPGGNATVGTITGDGVYTAPNTAGKHIVRVTDSTLNETTGAVVTVFSSIAVDFGSRTNTQYPIRAGILGVNHVDGLHDPTDMSLIAQAGVTLSRTYANVATVYATQTPNWTNIDPIISNLKALGMHVLLEVAFTPPWLQPSPNPCGAGNTAVAPTNINTWAQLAASYVAHMDANFPGVVTDYEIWNEPNAASLCGTSSNLNTYLAIYAAAAPLMKQQAATDGTTIRVGGPATGGLDTTYISALLSNSSTAPYVDFMSYHNYLAGNPGLDMTWDAYNGNESLYELTQSFAGADYSKAAGLVAAGQQPGGATTPIYIDEYNTNFAFAQDCCKNDPTYGPIWNALYVSDLLDQVYTGTPAVPGQLAYFAANAYPYFCLIGTWDANMDCQYTTGSTPVPYPQYYAYQLMALPEYLGMNSGGYMAASVSPAFAAGGIETTAFYTPNQDSILIVNPTSTAYSNITVTIENSGFSSPSANLYEVVNGQSISSSSITLTPSGSAYTVNISVPAYTALGISVQGP